VRRSPKRTYKGTRLYGVINANIDGTSSGGSGSDPPGGGTGKRAMDGGGKPSKKPRADVPENIQKLLEKMEESEEGQMKVAAVQVRALLQFMREAAVERAIQSAVEMMNAAHNRLAIQYGENAELIHAFFPIQPLPQVDSEDGSGTDDTFDTLKGSDMVRDTDSVTVTRSHAR
jgi:hypothetical protein